MTLFFYRNLLLISSQIKTFIAVVPFFQTYTLSVLKTQNFIPQEESEIFSSIIKINMRRSRIEERFILPPFVQPKTNLSDVLQEVRQQPTTKEEKCWRLTVAAPLTCTDLLAVDRVPGTRSTDNCTSFGFTSVTFTSLKPTQTEDKKIKNSV